MQFALQQGQEAIGNTAAAKGGLLSGNAVADATKFAEGTAAQFENQAFNQNMAQNQLALGGMESLSQSAISTGVNPTADANANAILASGGAQAAGTVAGTNAMTQGLSGAANALDRGGAFDALGKIFGGGDTTASPDVGSYSSIPGAGVDYSDKRLKEDMELVGHTHDGLPIYVYRMKSGGPKKMGVMAQDVEKVNPGAVTQDRQGYKMVDYSRVS
jgi:hypothetical protein